MTIATGGPADTGVEGSTVRLLRTTEPDHTAPGTPQPEGTSASPDRGPRGDIDLGEVPVHAVRAAHAVVRIALEVVDRRRPPERARAAFTPPLVDMLTSLAASDLSHRRLGPARLHRVHAQAPAAPTDADGTGVYEIVATYSRGPRLFGIGARIVVGPSSARCVAFRMV